MRDAVVRNAMLFPYGEAVEKIGGVAMAWPHNDTVNVMVFVGEIIAGIDVHSHLAFIDDITHAVK